MKTAIISGPHFVTEALFGIGLSYGLTSGIENVKDLERAECYDRLMQIARGLAHKLGGGHNKFLETITLTLDVKAPRYWWQEFDTYRVGVTKQSESTMHTLLARPFSINDFEIPANPKLRDLMQRIDRKLTTTDEVANDEIDGYVAMMKDMMVMIKKILPECYLQRRIVCLNAKALQNMYNQRKTHRLPEWQTFLAEVRDQMTKREHGLFVADCVFGGGAA